MIMVEKKKKRNRRKTEHESLFPARQLEDGDPRFMFSMCAAKSPALYLL